MRSVAFPGEHGHNSIEFRRHNSEGETPGPIPNPEAKPFSADGTALVTGWESRTPPDIFTKGLSDNGGPFVVSDHTLRRIRSCRRRPVAHLARPATAAQTVAASPGGRIGEPATRPVPTASRRGAGLLAAATATAPPARRALTRSAGRGGPSQPCPRR